MLRGRGGRLAVVGLGPGGPATTTPEVAERLARATDIVGYATYVARVPERRGQRRHASDNRVEADRSRHALDLAEAGGDVVVVSSGDPGVFAMAAAVLEELEAGSVAGRWAGVELAILPGVTAATAAAALVGAPLGHDFCVISLSDVLKPWELVERRLDAAAGADFVLALYNPISRHRPWQLGRALEIIGRHRSPETPVVLARDVGGEAQAVATVALGELDPARADMRTILLVGSSATRRFHDASGHEWVFTPRRVPAPAD